MLSSMKQSFWQWKKKNRKKRGIECIGGGEREERRRPQHAAGSYTIDERCRTYYIQARTKSDKKGKKEFGLCEYPSL